MYSEFHQRNCTVVMYHYIRDYNKSDFKNIKGVTIEKFKKQLDFIEKNYTVIDIEDYILYLEGREDVPKNSLILTFDDGIQDHYQYVMPELIERNLTGVFYISGQPLMERIVLNVHRVHHLLSEVDIHRLTNEYVVLFKKANEDEAERVIEESKGAQNRFDSADVARFKVMARSTSFEIRDKILKEIFKKFIGNEYEFATDFYLTPTQVKTMHDKGMKIGAHGYNHELFTSIKIDVLLAELRKVKELLESIIKAPVEHLSFPNGRHDDIIRAGVREAGYRSAVTVVPEVNIGYVDQFRISRIDTNDLII